MYGYLNVWVKLCRSSETLQNAVAGRTTRAFGCIGSSHQSLEVSKCELCASLKAFLIFANRIYDLSLLIQSLVPLPSTLHALLDYAIALGIFRI